jgi:hypothetical protein
LEHCDERIVGAIEIEADRAVCLATWPPLGTAAASPFPPPVRGLFLVNNQVGARTIDEGRDCNIQKGGRGARSVRGY